MATVKPKLKSSFKLSRSYEPIHTGGKTALSGDGTWLVSTLQEQALVTDLETGERIKYLPGDTSAVTTLALTPSPASPHSGGFLLTCHRSLALHIYALPSLSLHRSIPKAHAAPIITCVADPTGTLFATGSADGIIKVWDANKGHCTHVFKGHGGVISALVFDVGQAGKGAARRAKLISGADDCMIRVWDLLSRECLHLLEGHVSVVRGLDVTKDGKTMVSGGRDKVVNVWDLERGVLRRTMPVFETLEAVGLVQVDGKGKGKGKEGEMVDVIFTGGDKGVIRLWDLVSGQQIVGKEETKKAGKTHEILDILNTPLTSSLTAIHFDQNLITFSLPSLTITRQLIGYNDEVIDTVFLSSPTSSSSTTSTTPSVAPKLDTHLAVATNSDLIRIYDLSKFSTTLLEGHSDVVLCLAKSVDGQVLISGSKDKTARVWNSTPGEEEGTLEWKCLGQAVGHVESVGAVAVSKKDRSFLVTASQDRTAKIWDLGALLDDSAPSSSDTPLASLRSLTTSKIHDKDINSLDIAPNDKLLASGSQDRTAKLFSITYTPKSKGTPLATASLNLLGTFKGHKRGVWSVKFSPSDQCLATGSGDRTIKLWSLADFSCIKTFEGHSNSVLRVDFLTKGMQLASCASDGLVKVWTVKDEECTSTLDNHEEKVWALAVGAEEKVIVSGGADSVISFWEDVTVTVELEKVAVHEEQVLKEQDFENYLSIQDYSNAILLALSMDQPRRLLKLFIEVRSSSTSPDSITGSEHVDTVLKSLSPTDLRQLLLYIKDWNTVSRTSDVAQTVLYAILKFHSAEQVLACLEGKQVNMQEGKDGIEEEEEEDDDEEVTEEEKRRRRKEEAKKREMKAGMVLGALIPYTERHFGRADKLVRESYIVDFLLGQIEAYDVLGGDEMVVDQEEEEDRVVRVQR